MASYLKITADDPFIKRIFLDNMPMRRGPAWTFEAYRRCMARGLQYPYRIDEQTFAWRLDVVDMLMATPIKGDVTQCEIDPNGPGFGFHVFEDADQELYLESNEIVALPSARFPLGPSGRINVSAVSVSKVDGINGFEFFLDPSTLASPRVTWTGTASERARVQKFLDAANHNHRHPMYKELALKMQAFLAAKRTAYREEVTPRAIRRRSKRETGEDMDTAVQVVYWPHTITVTEGSGRTITDRLRPGLHWVQAHCKVQNGKLIWIDAYQRGDKRRLARPRPPTVNVPLP